MELTFKENKIKLSEKNKSGSFIISTFFFFACIVNHTILLNVAGTFVSIQHLVAVSLFILAISRKKLILPNKYLLIFIFYAVVLSAIVAPTYGFDAYIIAYFFNLLLIISIMTIGADFSFAYWLTLVRRVAIVVIVLVSINTLLNFSAVVSVFRYGGRAFMPSLFVGGINLDSSWIAMFSVFFLKRPKGYFYFALSVIISVLYASRAGMLINVLVFLWVLFSRKRSKRELRAIIFIFCVLAILFVAGLSTGLISNAIYRFQMIGYEPGSISRLNKWSFVLVAFLENPFGYGVGNAVSVLPMFGYTGRIYANIHNIYFQVLLDLGIIGFVFYMAMVVFFFVKEFKNRFENPFAALIGVYLVIGLVQFGGISILFAFFLGIYFCTKNKLKHQAELDPK
ncbi:MAG: O-antigen ligase family protein [Oscillospiraceae bacterium]|nr:O-antigen ligase family protein [Oscillospiraceae bacterium]